MITVINSDGDILGTKKKKKKAGNLMKALKDEDEGKNTKTRHTRPLTATYRQSNSPHRTLICTKVCEDEPCQMYSNNIINEASAVFYTLTISSQLTRKERVVTS